MLDSHVSHVRFHLSQKQTLRQDPPHAPVYTPVGICVIKGKDKAGYNPS